MATISTVLEIIRQTINNLADATSTIIDKQKEMDERLSALESRINGDRPKG